MMTNLSVQDDLRAAHTVLRLELPGTLVQYGVSRAG